MRTIFKHLFFWLIISFWTSTIYIFNEHYWWEFVQFNLVRLPLIMAATYLAVYYLLPKYILQKRQYLKFGVAFTTLFITATLLDRCIIGSSLIDQILKDTGLTYTFFNEIPLIRNAFLLLSIIGLATAIKMFNFYQENALITPVLEGVPIRKKSIISEQLSVKNKEDDKNVFTNNFLLKSGAITHQLNWTNIMFLEKNENYVIYHTKKKRILERTTLSKLSPKLPDYFCRAHRSFIVSLKHIDQIERDFIMIKGKKVPIGRTYKGCFLEQIEHLDALGNC